MRVLDLYAGAGGATKGYMDAGATFVCGVDIEPQPNYIGQMFYRMDALDFMLNMDVSGFDLIHASPPCQAFSLITPDKSAHPNLIPVTRQLLEDSGVPYVMENVPGAPLRKDVMLCGSMFGLQVRRHRIFELSGFPYFLTPSCNHKSWESGRPHTVAGHVDGPNGMWSNHHYGVRDLNHARELMGMPWAQTIHEIAEAIPPAYTKFLGEAFISQKVTA